VLGRRRDRKRKRNGGEAKQSRAEKRERRERRGIVPRWFGAQAQQRERERSKRCVALRWCGDEGAVVVVVVACSALLLRPHLCLLCLLRDAPLPSPAAPSVRCLIACVRACVHAPARCAPCSTMPRRSPCWTSSALTQPRVRRHAATAALSRIHPPIHAFVRSCVRSVMRSFVHVFTHLFYTAIPIWFSRGLRTPSSETFCATPRGSHPRRYGCCL